MAHALLRDGYLVFAVEEVQASRIPCGCGRTRRPARLHLVQSLQPAIRVFDMETRHFSMTKLHSLEIQSTFGTHETYKRKIQTSGMVIVG